MDETTHTPVTFWIKNEHVSRFVDGLAGHYGYRTQEDFPEDYTEVTKPVYIKRKIKKEWVDRVRTHEARELARQNKPEEIEVTEE